MRGTRTRPLGLGLLAVGVLALAVITSGWVGSESTGSVRAVATTTMPLQNDTAPTVGACPSDTVAWWRFSVSAGGPDDAIETIVLNLAGTMYTFTGAQLYHWTGQLDEAHVAVPDGYVPGDLIASGSYALVSGSVLEHSQFRLTGICEGPFVPTTTTQATTTTPAPTTTAPTTTAPATTTLPESTTTVTVPESTTTLTVPQTTTTVTVPIVTTTVPAPASTLPATGGSGAPLALVGATLLGLGALAVMAVRGRTI